MMLAFVPARGESKGIARKNLALLAGKPLIQYTLEAALGSRFVDEIFLSTDDEEIAAFCRTQGVDTSYRRPTELASDTAAMLDALKHGLRWFGKARGRLPEEVIVLQPTSPLRTSGDIDFAIERFQVTGADTLLSVHRMAEHPCECVVAGPTDWNYLVPPPAGAVRRQDYADKFYFINGAIYLARVAHVLGGGSIIVPGRSALYEMAPERGVDIDTPLNLSVAEALLLQQRKQV